MIYVTVVYTCDYSSEGVERVWPIMVKKIENALTICFWL